PGLLGGGRLAPLREGDDAAHQDRAGDPGDGGDREGAGGPAQPGPSSEGPRGPAGPGPGPRPPVGRTSSTSTSTKVRPEAVWRTTVERRPTARPSSARTTARVGGRSSTRARASL